TNTIMDIDPPKLAENRADSSGDILPLLDTTTNRRYQAYCATEASSRHPSPDTLAPRPLRTKPSPHHERDIEPKLESHNVAQPTATSAKVDDGIATLPKWKYQSNEPVSANEGSQSRRSMLGNDNHITQAVTPRGSHQLAGSQTMMCDSTPSHSRMQPRGPGYVAASWKVRRRTSPQYVGDACMNEHPLPP
ncbi:hypothetical protein EK21DRAFT_27997, partial [Setomelanomma holmii]